MDEDERNRKHGRSTIFVKRHVFRLDLNESREGFCRRGRGRSFQVDGPKTEMARKPTAERLVRGIWRLRVSEVERRILYVGAQLRTCICMHDSVYGCRETAARATVSPSIGWA